MSVLLAAAAAMLYSATDVTSAVTLRRVSPAAVAFWGHVIASVLLLGAALPAAAAPGATATLQALAAGAVAGVGVVAYYAALKRGPASVIAPLAASGLALPVMAGVLRAERTAVIAALGLAALLAGVTLLAGRDAEGRGTARGALALGALAALAFGGYFLTVDLAAGAAGAHPLWIAGIVTVGSALASLPVLAWTDRGRVLRPDRGALRGLLAVGVLLSLADLSLTAALASGDIALVTVIASSDPALTVLAARVVLAERVSSRQAAGIALSVAGLLAVAAA